MLKAVNSPCQQNRASAQSPQQNSCRQIVACGAKSPHCIADWTLREALREMTKIRAHALHSQVQDLVNPGRQSALQRKMGWYRPAPCRGCRATTSPCLGKSQRTAHTCPTCRRGMDVILRYAKLGGTCQHPSGAHKVIADAEQNGPFNFLAPQPRSILHLPSLAAALAECLDPFCVRLGDSNVSIAKCQSHPCAADQLSVMERA